MLRVVLKEAERDGKQKGMEGRKKRKIAVSEMKIKESVDGSI